MEIKGNLQVECSTRRPVQNKGPPTAWLLILGTESLQSSRTKHREKRTQQVLSFGGTYSSLPCSIACFSSTKKKDLAKENRELIFKTSMIKTVPLSLKQHFPNFRVYESHLEFNTDSSKKFRLSRSGEGTENWHF